MSKGLRIAGLGALVLLVVAGVWMVVTARQAQSALEQARAQGQELQAALVRGDEESANALLVDVQESTAKAVRATSGPVWAVAGSVPLLGRTPDAVAATSEVLDDVASTALPALVEAGELLDPAELRGDDGRSLDVDRMRQAAEPLDEASAALATAVDRIEAVDLRATPGAVSDGVRRAQDGLAGLAGSSRAAADVAAIGPAMLGADERRRYLLAVQTPAEARGTGGLLGSYGVIEADEGRVRIVTLGPRRELDRFSRQSPAVDFGPEYAALWGDDPGLWVNANSSPHFPYAAQLWREMATDAGLGPIDGVIATDPVALAGLLQVTGPARLPDGSTVPGERFAAYVTKDVYVQEPDDDVRRDEVLQGVARAAVDSVLSGRGDAGGLLSALTSSVSDRRLLMWSAWSEEQEILQAHAIGGAVPEADDPSVGPYAFVVVNNAAGTKLDSYLERRIEFKQESCESGPDGLVPTMLSIGLTNTAPAFGLPPYVTKRSDEGAAEAEPGSNRLLVTALLSDGVALDGARADGVPIDVDLDATERGRPVARFLIDLPPGQTREVVLDLREEAWGSPARVDVQPLVLDQSTVVVGPNC